MGHTPVRTHTRRGHPVRAHSRRTANHLTASDILHRDSDSGPLAQPRAGAASSCPHPAWYPIKHVDGDILAWVCTDCTASRMAA